MLLKTSFLSVNEHVQFPQVYLTLVASLETSDAKKKLIMHAVTLLQTNSDEGNRELSKI